MAIIIVDNFQVDINNPIDNRFVVGSQSIPSGGTYPTPFYAYRNDIVYKYPGLRIWDFNDNIPYVWNGTTWINENTTGAIVFNSGQPGGTGYKDYVTKFLDNQTLLGKSNIYDNGTHVGIGLTGSAMQPSTTPYPIVARNNGLHVDGHIRTNGYFIGKIYADYIVDGSLNLARITPPGTTPGLRVLKNTTGDNSGTSWDLLSNIIPTNAINLTPTTTGTGITVGNIYAGALASQYEFKPLISSGLQITDSANEIRIESKVGLTSSTGIPVYTGLNTDNRHVFKNITSGSLDVTTDGDNVKVELHVDVNDKAFYVNGNYSGPEQGTLAKPFKNIESALYAFVGKGTRWNPEWRGRGKIILLSYIAPTLDMASFWNHVDTTGVLINQIKDNTGTVVNSQINTNGWLSVNNVNIDGQGNGFEYQGTLPTLNPYWLSTEKFINFYESSSTESINNTFSANQYSQAVNLPLIDTVSKKLNIDIYMIFKNIDIISDVHQVVYHLNYSWGVYQPQPSSWMRFINCNITDNGYVQDKNAGKFIKITNTWNGAETHFGSEVWVENRINPATGLSTGIFIPTDQYMIRIEGRNWTNEGYFEMTDCTLAGSTSTIIYVKNTSVGFTNLTLSRNSDYIAYGGSGTYDGLGKDYYNHPVDISWHTPSTVYSYSPYTPSSGTPARAIAWVNRYMPKKDQFYIRVEGVTGTTNNGINTDSWCRVVNLKINNTFATTPYRNNQRGHTYLNSGLNPQIWVDDTVSGSSTYNYNKLGYFRVPIGGTDALFKIDGNSYFRVDGGYVYGESANNIIHKSNYAGVDFVDCNFDNLECIDMPSQEWSSTENNLKRGAFRLATSLGTGTINRTINLVSSKVNFVIFKGASPYPTTTQFYDALRDGLGWDSNFIYPYSPDSTINKVSFSSTTPMIGGADVINSTTNNSALNTNVGYNAYKLIPGNKYYNTSGGLTVVKVPSAALTITLPTEFNPTNTTHDTAPGLNWTTQP